MGKARPPHADDASRWVLVERFREMNTDVELTDGTVLVRPCRPSDTDRVYEAVSESIEEVSPWATWCHPDYSIDEARIWLESRADAWSKGTDYDFAVLDPNDGSFLGGCGLNQFNRVHNFANIGYWTRTTRTCQGVATAAARLIAQFGFDQLGLTRIEIVTAVANQASQRVAEKLGATREGIMRNRHVVRDKVYAAVMFSLIPKDMGKPMRS